MLGGKKIQGHYADAVPVIERLVLSTVYLRLCLLPWSMPPTGQSLAVVRLGWHQ